MEGARKREIHKWKAAKSSTLHDLVTVEEPLELRIRHYSEGIWSSYPLAVTMRTPGNEEEWARGFLYTEGVISNMDEVEYIRSLPPDPSALATGTVEVKLSMNSRFEPRKSERHFYMNSSCGVCGKTAVDQVKQHVPFILPLAKPSIDSDVLLHLPDRLIRATPIFTKTGSIHATALFDASGVLRLLREDVGRHNAMDKLLGAAWKEFGFPLLDLVCLVSGRASFELVQKALMAGIPILCAIGAPSSLAVELAEAHQMTLVGFLKANSFNVYTGWERIAGEV